MIREGLTPDAISYTIVIDHLCRLDRVDQACDLFIDTVTEGRSHDVVSYNSLIYGFYKVFRATEVVELF
ncbi:hypothetical protein SUGI_0979660 [Cryptomeria japonica]|nr:hypothetical protein SUGI_0979660 [Cryptomeria japonica]